MGKIEENNTWREEEEGAAAVKLVKDIEEIYRELKKQESLKPSKAVNALFSDLVALCTPPSTIDVNSLSRRHQKMRRNLIQICGHAEGLLESHYSQLLATQHSDPVEHLAEFPYYDNYKKLAKMEVQMIKSIINIQEISKVAFVGSGPMPLTTLVMATEHMTNVKFDNYDVDANANDMAEKLIAARPELASRVSFLTSDIMRVTEDGLGDCDVVVLAALVGMRRRDKVAIVRHLREHMKAGSLLLVRSAHGARAFLYPVVDESYLVGFQVESVVHPADDVINSVILARRC